MRALIKLDVSRNPMVNEQQLFYLMELKRLKFFNIADTPAALVCERLQLY